MTAAVTLEVAAVMLLASIVRSAFGFGEALVAVPLLALAIPVKTAAPVAVLASILVAGVVVAQDRRHVHWRSAGLLVLSTFFGIPFGLFLLKTVSEPAAKAVLGAAVGAYALHALLGRRRASLADDRYAWAFGFAAGVFGGAYGLNGPPLAAYGAMRGWTRERFRATLQGYFLPASAAGMCGYAVSGLWKRSVSGLFLWSLPSVLAGVFIGRALNRRLDEERFLRCLHVGLALVGALLLGQAALRR